jgi:leader peptidase (prepilin peptidase) / N-methyltransferase
MNDAVTAVMRITLFLAFAVPASVVDIREYRIPNVLAPCGLASLLALDILSAPAGALAGAALADAAAAVLTSLSFLAVRRFVGGLGWGDVKFSALAAFFSGLPYCFAAMLIASAAALLYVAAAMVLKRFERGARIPFAPFIAGGAMAAGAARLLAAR